METIKLGKRGTFVMPAKIRKQFGLEDGSLLSIESRDGEIRLRPAVTVEYEIYTPERMAEFYLNNSLSKEDWDDAARDVRALGLDPLTVPNTDPNMRDTLPTAEDLEALFERIKAKHPARKIA
jgi:AbrB family looped-hinge helix DNA binding protein